MPDSARHFTVVDDWVMLNSDITATEYRVYSIIKANIRHTYGGIPETGFRATAAWISAVSNGIIAVSTAHRAIQGLAKKGVLRRLNDPKSGEGADFEFIFNPDESYTGPRSVMSRAAEMSGKQSRSVVFVAIPLDTKPPRQNKAKDSELAEVLMMDNASKQAEAPEGPDVEEDIPDEESLELDASDLQELDGSWSLPDQPTPEMVKFADELEFVTSKNSEDRLRLMAGACRRIAKAVKPVLERGWEPTLLARRLSSELNPRIHSPEKLLISKVADLGDPPANRRSDGKIRVSGKLIDPSLIDLGFGHDSAPVKEAPKISPDAKQRRESQSDRLANLARGYSR